MRPNKRCRPLLGTYVEIEVDKHPDAIDLALGAIEMVQRLMSFHRQDSDLNKINRLSSGQSLQIHPWTWTVLHKALEIHLCTMGAFDCSIKGCMSSLELLENHIVRVKETIKLDLGGIAKGFAVDQAIETLQLAGVCQAVVNAGGDLRIYGTTPKSISIRDPNQPACVYQAGHLTCGSIATSAPYFSYENTASTITCALMNPFTKLSICDLKSYSVIAPRCMDADALTKALAVHQDTEAAYFKTYQAHALLN